LLDAIAFFGGSELGVNLVSDRVVVLSAIGVVALAVEKFNTTRFLLLMYSLNFLKLLRFNLKFHLGTVETYIEFHKKGEMKNPVSGGHLVPWLCRGAGIRRQSRELRNV
jgi:hypothetical protein